MANITDYQQGMAVASGENALMATANATAPGAVATIASVTPTVSGMYRITVTAGYGGTADVIDNMDLAINAVQVAKVPVTAAINGVRNPVSVKRRVVAGQVVAVRSVAAGAGGSVYCATVVAERVSD